MWTKFGLLPSYHHHWVRPRRTHCDTPWRRLMKYGWVPEFWNILEPTRPYEAQIQPFRNYFGSWLGEEQKGRLFLPAPNSWHNLFRLSPWRSCCYTTCWLGSCCSLNRSQRHVPFLHAGSRNSGAWQWSGWGLPVPSMLQVYVALPSGKHKSFSIAESSKVGDLKRLAQKSFEFFEQGFLIINAEGHVLADAVPASCWAPSGRSPDSNCAPGAVEVIRWSLGGTMLVVTALTPRLSSRMCSRLRPQNVHLQQSWLNRSIRIDVKCTFCGLNLLHCCPRPA